MEIAFTDIDETNLRRTTELAERDIAANGLKTRITATTDRREALSGARYVFNLVRIGGLDAFSTDVEIPLRYGIDQCVGDTLCAGGIMYGQRGIPVMLEFCRDIREVAEPGCLLLNYANPMAMITWACNKFGGVETVGLCQGVQHGHGMIAEVLGLEKDEVDIICAGINHQTWYVKVQHKGEDLTGKLLEAFERHPKYSRKEKVRIDMLRRFGYFSTESNGHLSEYLPWYRKRRDEIEHWIARDDWFDGETGGYLRICRVQDSFENDHQRWLEELPMEFTPRLAVMNTGQYIIEALRLAGSTGAL